MDMAQKVGISIGFTGLAIGILRIALEVLGMNMPHWLAYILVILAVAMFAGGWLFVLWGQFRRLISRFPFRANLIIRRIKDDVGSARTSYQITWLEKVMNDDIASLKSGVDRRVYCSQFEIFYEGITKTEPYIKLNFCALNATVFTLVVEGVEGTLDIEYEPCVQHIEFVGEDKPIEIKHAESHLIKIKQGFTTREKAEKIRSQGRQKHYLKMNLSKCYLIVRPQIPGQQVESLKVPVSGNIERIDYTEP